MDTANMLGSLADRDRWQATGCTIDATMQAIGNRSSLLIMREAFYGTRRFDDFAKRVGISEAVAAARLRELVSLGVLERQPYRDAGQRTRHEYLLTEAGRDFLPVALALMQWGDRHLTGPAGPRLQLTHHDCGSEVAVQVRCGEGHQVGLAELDVSRRSSPRQLADRG